MAIATLWNNIWRSDARAEKEAVCEESQRGERLQYWSSRVQELSIAFEDEKEKAGILSETYLSIDEAQTSLCYLKVISRPHLEIVKDVN